jgi:hypothetical protein
MTELELTDGDGERAFPDGGDPPALPSGATRSNDIIPFAAQTSSVGQ